MTERERLLDRLTALERERQAGAVATVVQVAGSHYRRAGARMLYCAGGERVGMLAGGCYDLDERARQAMASGRTSLHRYDTTAPADAVLGSGSGCQGVVDILLAPVDDGLEPSLSACLEPSVRRGEPAVLATVVGPAELEGSQTRLGARLLVTQDGRACGALGAAELQAAVERDARQALGSERVGVRPYQAGGDQAKVDEVQVMIEGLAPARRLLLFGAGEDAPPIVRIACEVGLHVTVADHRPAFTDPWRVPGADSVLLASEPAAVVRRTDPGPRTACVLATHDYLRDLAILRELAATEAAYVGVIGPRARAQRLLAEAGWPAAECGRLYCPAGLDIGAETPEGIALSVVAEAAGVLAGRSGGHLRARGGPIHDAAP